jgi:HK97 family phage major capsid protein
MNTIRSIEGQLRAAGKSRAESKRMAGQWASLQSEKKGNPMMSSNLQRALSKFAPAYRRIAENDSGRFGGPSLNELIRARAAIADGPDVASAGTFSADLALAREGAAELDRLIARKKSEQLEAMRGARPVAGQDVHSAGGWGGAPLLRDVQTGRKIRAYRHDEPVASDGGQPDFGIGDVTRACITGDWSRIPSHVRAGAAGIGAAGGFLIAPELAGYVIDLARAKARVLQAGAQTVPMVNGNLTVAIVTGDPVASWKAENAAFAVSQGSYGEITLTTKTLGVIVPLSLELVMSAANLNDVVTTQLVKALGLELDSACISADGTLNTPRGIVAHLPADNIVPVGASLAAATAYSYYGSAIGKCLAANAEIDSLSILQNSDVDTALDGLVDTLYQPLRPSPNFAKIADAGRKYVANGIVTSGTPASTYAVVGDFSQVLIGMQQSLMIEVSREGGYGVGESAGNAFAQGQVLLRALIMCDVAILRPTWFAQISDIRI